MRSPTLLFGLFVFLGLLGCGPSGHALAPEASDFEGRLKADTGVAWRVDRDSAGAPLLLTATSRPAPIAKTTSREQATIGFFQQYADILGVGTLADELVLVADERDAASNGSHHVRFAQRIPRTDVRVFGAELLAHFDASGALRSAQVGLVRDISKISPRPARTVDDARDAAIASRRARSREVDIRVAHKAPELLVHWENDGHGRLAWRVFLEQRGDFELEAHDVIVDAANLAILEASEAFPDHGPLLCPTADTPHQFAEVVVPAQWDPS